MENFSFGELDIFSDDIAEVVIESNDEEFFLKCTEIWNKIIELIDTYNPPNFVEYYLDENGDDTEDEFKKKFKKKMQVLLEITIEIILYLFLHLFIIIFSVHH